MVVVTRKNKRYNKYQFKNRPIINIIKYFEIYLKYVQGKQWILLLSDYMKQNHLLHINNIPTILYTGSVKNNLRFVDNLDGHCNKTVQCLRLLCTESS